MTKRKGLLSQLLPEGAAGAKPEFDLRPAWRRADPDIARDAIAFWNRLGILPAGVKPEDRASELVAAAYRGNRLVGVTTAAPARLEQLRSRFLYLRGAVDPEQRRSALATTLALYSRDLLERWSAENPGERVLGLAAVVESPDLAERQRQPYWPQTRFGLVGFTPEGRQIRVAWFAHAELEGTQ